VQYIWAQDQLYVIRDGGVFFRDTDPINTTPIAEQIDRPLKGGADVVQRRNGVCYRGVDGDLLQDS
jgi:hypothetical protein